MWSIHTRYGDAFRVRYRVPTPSGKWIHRSETLRVSKKQARAILNQRILEVRESLTVPLKATELTVKDFVESYWRPYLQRRQVKPSTLSSYECGLQKHVLPTLGEILLTEVTPLYIEELVCSRSQAGLAPKTVRNLVALLQSIFSLAVENDLLPRSPVRGKHKPSVMCSDRPIWTAEQIRQIVQAVPTIYRCLFHCAALTAARLGELLALKWDCVHFEQQRLDIRQSLWHGQLGTPKTQGSIRSIYPGPRLMEVLADHRQHAMHNSAGDFVFCRPDGTPLRPDLLRRDVLYPILDRLQIPRSLRTCGFHTFRHSAASIVNAETGNLKLAQRLLGHANWSTTADIYTHTQASAEREATLALERAVLGNLFHVVPQVERGTTFTQGDLVHQTPEPRLVI